MGASKEISKVTIRTMAAFSSRALSTPNPLIPRLNETYALVRTEDSDSQPTAAQSESSSLEDLESEELRKGIEKTNSKINGLESRRVLQQALLAAISEKKVAVALKGEVGIFRSDAAIRRISELKEELGRYPEEGVEGESKVVYEIPASEKEGIV